MHQLDPSSAVLPIRWIHAHLHIRPRADETGIHETRVDLLGMVLVQGIYRSILRNKDA